MSPQDKYDWPTLVFKLREALLAHEVEPVMEHCARFLGVNRSTLKSALNRYGVYTSRDLKKWATGETIPPPEAEEPLLSAFERRADGTMSINKVILLTEEEALDEDTVVDRCGFNPDIWKVLRIRVNAWNAQRPEDRGQLINHQVRADLAPKSPGDISLRDVRKFFDEQKLPNIAVKRPIKMKAFDETANALEICLADLHNARMTRSGYSAEDCLYQTIDDILLRTKGRKFSKIYFAPLGDIVDADTMNATTTKGTQQFITMTPYCMLSSAADMLIEAIERLREIAPIHYIFVPGNHDEILSFAIALIISKRFYGDEFFSADLGELPHKWSVFGKCLIAWTHGNISKQNAFSWLPVRAREEWGQTEFAEIHSGHKNAQTVTEHGGQVVRYLSSPVDTSLWEDKEGYSGLVRSTSSFIWHPEKGLRDQWFSNV